MGLTIGEAAQQTGKSKSTLSRAIKQGKISASRNNDGSFSIEPAELFRVYKRVLDATVATVKTASDDAPRNSIATPEKDIEIATLQAELTAEKNKVQDLLELANEIRADRDAWKTQAARLLAAPSREQKLGLWRRFFGT